MLDILSDRTFRALFLAQLLALFGTGLATVALALLAFDLAGADAGLVLGTALTLKMIAYVGLSPVLGAISARAGRKALLFWLGLARAGVAVCLPFVTEVWQIYALMLLLHSASAVFTPTFQATIPDVLPDEARYTRALSLSRVAYDLENILSPALAGLLLAVMSYGTLFYGTALGHLASALLIVSAVLPARAGSQTPEGSVARQALGGLRRYLEAPHLRGLLALTLSVAAAGAMVLVNTVVIVRGDLERPERAVAWALLAYGSGSILAALLLPRVLDGRRERPFMLAGAWIAVGALGLLGVWSLAAPIGWTGLLLCWAVIGLGTSAVLTPTGRLLRRSARQEDRTSIFVQHFSLSHACWLVTYPLAGTLSAYHGTTAACLGLAGLGAAGVLAAQALWPVRQDG